MSTQPQPANPQNVAAVLNELYAQRRANLARRRAKAWLRRLLPASLPQPKPPTKGEAIFAVLAWWFLVNVIVACGVPLLMAAK